jgi:hypothetical protein
VTGKKHLPAGVISLTRGNPTLASEWHPTKNGSLTPHDVSSASSLRVWWKCINGADHEWITSVSNRNAGSGCPICSGRKVVLSNCLATLYPEIAAQWHPRLNGKKTPYTVTAHSQQRVWWKCDKGDDHEWKASVAERVKGLGCAVCSNYRVVTSNCLATLNPELAAQWHPKKNGNLTPYDVHPGSAKMVWWKCDKGPDHEWKTVVHSRTFGRGCPICSGRKVAPSTCLETLNPKLAKEWHPIKNGNLTPRDVGIHSKKKVWWKCEMGDDHEWEAIIDNRNRGLGCAICSNQKIVPSNSLATLNPELSALWYQPKNGKLTPHDVGPGSGKIVWFKCPKGDDHVWRASIAKQNKRISCPVCSGRKVVPSNCLSTLYPEIAAQWHPELNGVLTPEMVRPGSQKRVWWICPRNSEHIWRTYIADRTYGTGCPECGNQTSIPELLRFSTFWTRAQFSLATV